MRQLLGVVPGQLLSEMIRAIHAGDARLVLERVDQLVTDGYELSHFCGQFTRYVRNLMIAKSCGSESPLAAGSERRARHARGTVAASRGRGPDPLLPDPAAHGRRNAVFVAAALSPGTGTRQTGARSQARTARKPAGRTARQRRRREARRRSQAFRRPPTSGEHAGSGSLLQSAGSYGPSAGGAPGLSAPASAPALAPTPPPGIVSQGEDTHLTAIKSLASNQTKFLGSLPGIDRRLALRERHRALSFPQEGCLGSRYLAEPGTAGDSALRLLPGAGRAREDSCYTGRARGTGCPGSSERSRPGGARCGCRGFPSEVRRYPGGREGHRRGVKP